MVTLMVVVVVTVTVTVTVMADGGWLRCFRVSSPLLGLWLPLLSRAGPALPHQDRSASPAQLEKGEEHRDEGVRLRVRWLFALFRGYSAGPVLRILSTASLSVEQRQERSGQSLLAEDCVRAALLVIRPIRVMCSVAEAALTVRAAARFLGFGRRLVRVVRRA